MTHGIDWRELYAANQAAIARAGIAPTPAPHATPGIAPTPAPHPEPGGNRATAPGRSGRSASELRIDPQTLVHVPRWLNADEPVPLVCMLHGCTQDPAKFAAATLMNEAADRHGFVVVYPGQDRRRNSQGCWNWFAPEHQQRDRGEPATIAATLRSVIDGGSRQAIDRDRVFIAGLSAGGAMAAVMSACYPELFAAVAVHSGLAYRSASDVRSAFAAMGRGGAAADRNGRGAGPAMPARPRVVPTMVIQGAADRTVAPSNAIMVLRQSMSANHLAAPTSCDHDVEHPTTTGQGPAGRGHPYTQSRWVDADGRLTHELLMIDGLGHAWSGGAVGGSYTDPLGPSATEAVWGFFTTTSAAAGARPGQLRVSR